MVTREFLLAGDARFTVRNDVNGERYTFRVRRKESRQYGETFFVSLLAGPDNEEDYVYMGVLTEGSLRLTRASRYREDSKPVRVFGWFVKLLWAGEQLPQGYSAHHEGRCGRCGRVLTVPESVVTGFGPECIEHIPGGPQLRLLASLTQEERDVLLGRLRQQPES